MTAQIAPIIGRYWDPKDGSVPSNEDGAVRITGYTEPSEEANIPGMSAAQGTRIEEKLDRLVDRVGELGATVAGSVERQDAARDRDASLSRRADDHEKRIRRLEHSVTKIITIASLAGAAVSGLLSLLTKLL